MGILGRVLPKLPSLCRVAFILGINRVELSPFHLATSQKRWETKREIKGRLKRAIEGGFGGGLVGD